MRDGIRYWLIKDRYKKAVVIEPDEDDLASAGHGNVLSFWAYWYEWALEVHTSYPFWTVNDIPAGGPPKWRHVRPDVFVVDGVRPSYYLHEPLPCELGGRAYRVHPLGRVTPYHVRIGTPEECSCECLGYESRRKCRHVLALLDLPEEKR